MKLLPSSPQRTSQYPPHQSLPTHKAGMYSLWKSYPVRNHAIPVIKPCSFHPFLLKMLFSFDTITNLWLFFNNRQQFYIKIPHSTASQSGGILKGRISISLSSSFINWIFLLCPLFCFLFTFFYKKYFTLSKHNNLC